jgi:hypothetical protein
MRDARQRLQDIADALWIKAVDAHAEGMALIERSARLRQLSQICTTDEQAERMLVQLEQEGLVEPSIPCTSDGGEA